MDSMQTKGGSMLTTGGVHFVKPLIAGIVVGDELRHIQGTVVDAGLHHGCALNACVQRNATAGTGLSKRAINLKVAPGPAG